MPERTCLPGPAGSRRFTFSSIPRSIFWPRPGEEFVGARPARWCAGSRRTRPLFFRLRLSIRSAMSPITTSSEQGRPWRGSLDLAAEFATSGNRRAQHIAIGQLRRPFVSGRIVACVPFPAPGFPKRQGQRRAPRSLDFLISLHIAARLGDFEFAAQCPCHPER